MKTRLASVGLFMLVSMLVSAGALATEELNKQPQIQINVGGGEARVLDEVGNENGMGGGVRLLFPLSRYLKLNFESSGWFHIASKDPKPHRSLFMFAAGLDYAPGRHGVFAGAKVGFGFLDYEAFTPDSRRIQANKGGLAFGLHAGYMFKIGEKTSIGPRLDYGYLDVGKVVLNQFETTENDITGKWWLLSVAFQFP